MQRYQFRSANWGSMSSVRRPIQFSELASGIPHYLPDNWVPSSILFHRSSESSIFRLDTQRIQIHVSASPNRSLDPSRAERWSSTPKSLPSQAWSQHGPRTLDPSHGVGCQRKQPLVCFRGYLNSARFARGRGQLPSRWSASSLP